MFKAGAGGAKTEGGFEKAFGIFDDIVNRITHQILTGVALRVEVNQRGY